MDDDPQDLLDHYIAKFHEQALSNKVVPNRHIIEGLIKGLEFKDRQNKRLREKVEELQAKTAALAEELFLRVNTPNSEGPN